MSIQLVTYANQTVTPTNDAIIYEKAVDQNGIFYGCNVTVTSNNVNITGGYGIVCGREFVINGESIAVTLAPSGTLEGRLYVRLDLADADAPIQLLTATGNTLPPLVQDDDVNYTNGVYEMELATFTVGVSSLSDVVETFDTIKGMSDAFPSIENLATNVMLIRMANLRVLVLNGYVGANNTLQLPVGDWPSVDVRGVALRRNSVGQAVAVGSITVFSSTGYINRYYGASYNAVGTGLANVDASDQINGIVIWSV